MSDEPICKECNQPLSKHTPAIGFYYCPDGSEKSYEGVKCPPNLSEGDESDIAQEAHIKLESKGER